MTTLVLGRFQPLHRGHESLMRHALANDGRLVVGIGSSDSANTKENPFSAEERAEMIRTLLPGYEAMARLWIVEISDIDDPPNYVMHVRQTLQNAGAPDPDKVLGNSASMDLFEAAGIEVERPGLLERDWWQGKIIRDMMAVNDPHFHQCIPPTLRPLLEDMRATRRMARLHR